MMKLFIWEDIDGITDMWHDGGGLVIVAEDLADALAQWTARSEIGGTRDVLPEPDQVYELTGESERKVFVFPNAGCC